MLLTKTQVDRIAGNVRTEVTRQQDEYLAKLRTNLRQTFGSLKRERALEKAEGVEAAVRELVTAKALVLSKATGRPWTEVQSALRAELGQLAKAAPGSDALQQLVENAAATVDGRLRSRGAA